MTQTMFIEIDNEVIELTPFYDMEDIVRWADGDYVTED